MSLSIIMQSWVLCPTGATSAYLDEANVELCHARIAWANKNCPSMTEFREGLVL